jgi:hypothetical protein
LAIGTDAFGIPATVLSPALFLTVAASAVATPVLPVTASLLRWSGLKYWMEWHHPATVAAILLLIGLVLRYKGIHALRVAPACAVLLKSPG